MRRRIRGRRRVSVLIVDDEDDIRAVIRALLDGPPFGEVWDAATGEAALDAAYRNQPDLIILDSKMPGLDGEAVSKGLKILAPEAYVIVLSGVLTEPPEWGNGYLHKMEITRLRHVLETAFGPDGW